MLSARQTIHLVLKEINDCLVLVSSGEIDLILDELARSERIFIAGAGRSGLIIRTFAVRLTQMGKIVHVAGEPTTPAIRSGDILFVASGSGCTETIVAIVRNARRLRARVLLVTTDTSSPIGKLAHCVIKIPAPCSKTPPDIGVVRSIQPLGSLFEQSLFLFLDVVTLVMMGRENITVQSLLINHANM